MASAAALTPFDYVPVSSSTCYHQIKLPPYSTLEVLRRQLLDAVRGSAGLIDMS